LGFGRRGKGKGTPSNGFEKTKVKEIKGPQWFKFKTVILFIFAIYKTYVNLLIPSCFISRI
jgi:hypothetical protein